MPRPSYPLFEHLTRLDGVAAVPVRPRVPRRGGRSTSPASSARSTPRTRALLVVSPNNPTGSFVTRDELERLAALCAAARRRDHCRRSVRRLRARAGRGAAARPRARRAADVLVFALGGLSKSIGLPQVKLGVDRGRRARRGSSTRRSSGSSSICDTYLSVSTPVQAGRRRAARARRAGPRRRSTARIAANYRQLSDAGRRRAGVPRPATPRAAGTRVVQVPSLGSEEDLVVDLRGRRTACWCIPGYFFDFPRESFLVVSLLPPEARVRRRRRPRAAARRVARSPAMSDAVGGRRGRACSSRCFPVPATDELGHRRHRRSRGR